MCDTFVSLSNRTADGSIIFGKNSDREPNEAQSLEYHPGQNHSRGDMQACTTISVPQVHETLGTLISRPFWMWGAEMGANEKGVVIGNEAVFTKMPFRKEGVLTGMDLLRLALQRASTAQAALETIVQLLSDFGQGGICGYRDKKLTYHNSFIICDPNEAWVMETADHLWAAVQVREQYAISNCLTIGESCDLAHPDLILHARRKGWLKKGRDFHFANTYSDWLYTTFSGARTRKACSSRLLSTQQEGVDVAAAIEMLRSHGDQLTSLDTALIATGLCMHAGNGLTRNSQTTGSLVAHLAGTDSTFWVTGTSAPCTALFKPVWFQDRVLPDLGPIPTGTCDTTSLWWEHEVLHRLVMDGFNRIDCFSEERDLLEKSFRDQAARVDRKARYVLTEKLFSQSRNVVRDWITRSGRMPALKKNGILFRRYWQKQNHLAGMSTGVI